MTGVRSSHCSFCGHAFAAQQPWPRTCVACANVSYLNPLPVAVLVLPVDDGVLTVRRAIPPRQGELALPGGYINAGESWQAAAARELFEETQIRTDPTRIVDLRTLSAPDGTLLVFGRAAPCRSADLPPFIATEETSERVIVTAPRELGFSLHTAVLAEYLQTRGNQRS